MLEHVRILELLEEALSSGRTPEDVCEGSPDLLAAVRTRWEHCRRLDARLAGLFPSASSTGHDADTTIAADAAGTGRRSELPSIPGYVVEKVLGRGGVGIVYGARHLLLRRPVALKMLLAGAYAGRVERARFQREARAVAALRHAHVVQVHDVGEHDGCPYFTMELMEGGSLADRLGGVPQPCDRAAAMLIAIAGAVQEAHRAGIIHRDLKPENVLLATDGTPKVSDFGLAQSSSADGDTLPAGALTFSGARVGTPCYMAPEQAAGRVREIGPASDVYALGAILYEMLTGRPPFRGESTAETERQVIQDEPVPPARLNTRVPRDLETICLKCLSKAMVRRYGSARELAEDLGRFERGEPVVARRVGRLERAVKWARRRPGAAMGLAMAVALLMVVSAGVASIIVARNATAASVNELLTQADDAQRRGAWDEATLLHDRAADRLGEHRGLERQRAALVQGKARSALVRHLDDIRARRLASVAGITGFDAAAEAYARAFADAGIGQVCVTPAAEAAARLRDSPIRGALVTAVYDWLCCTPPRDRVGWLLDVARHADPDASPWHARALNLANYVSGRAADALVADARDLEKESAAFLLFVSHALPDEPRYRLPFLRAARLAHPGDFFANFELGNAALERQDWTNALRLYQSATALRPEIALAHDRLGIALCELRQFDEGLAELRLATRLDPTSGATFGNYGVMLLTAGRPAEAVVAFEQAAHNTRLGPPNFNATLPHVLVGLGDAYAHCGRWDDAAVAYREALTIEPARADAARAFAALSVRTGRAAGALSVFRAGAAAAATAKEADGEEFWTTYAAFAAFVDSADDYRAARRAMLDRFAGSQDPHVCERVGRACLLRPPESEADLKRATALIDRAVAADRVKQTWARPYFAFAKALAEHRAGRAETAAEIIEHDVGNVLVPGSHLVLALARAQQGNGGGARASLATAALGLDWSPVRADDGDHWMFHVLRRECERAVVPDLEALLDGRRPPRDGAECLCLLGRCQANDQPATAARLWAACFAKEPSYAARGRGAAVLCAARAGCGGGRDGERLDDAGRASLRAQARRWIRDELSVGRSTTAPGDAARSSDTLDNWSKSPELAGVRDPSALARLPDDERGEWLKLWRDVEAALKRADH